MRRGLILIQGTQERTHDAGKGSTGEGRDSEGNTVKYTIAGR